MREMPTPQHTNTTKFKSAKTCTILQLLSCSERSIRDSHWKTGFTSIILPIINNHPSQLYAADDLDCCFMAILSWKKPVDTRIMGKLWSNTATGHSAISRERGFESQLKAAAQRGYPTPQDTNDPMMAPPDYEIRQSGSVLELQSRDLW